MSEYKDHEFFEQVDDNPIRYKTKNLLWQLSAEDMAAEEKHWKLVHEPMKAANK